MAPCCSQVAPSSRAAAADPKGLGGAAGRRSHCAVQGRGCVNGRTKAPFRARHAAARTIPHSAAGPGGGAGGGCEPGVRDPRSEKAGKHREPLRMALEEGLAKAEDDRHKGGFLSRLGRGCAVVAAPGRHAPPGRERRKAALRSRGSAAARPAVLASPPRPAHPLALHTSRPARLPLAETIPVGAADWCLSPQLVCMRPCGAPGGGAAEKLTRSRRKCPAERLARSPPRARSGASRAARSAAAPPSAAAGRSGTEDGRAQPARGMEVAGSRRSRRAEGAPARYAAARPAAPGR